MPSHTVTPSGSGICRRCSETGDQGDLPIGLLRRAELPDPAVVEGVERNIMSEHGAAFNQCQCPVVKNEPASPVAKCDGSMPNSPPFHFKNDETQVIGDVSKVPQRRIFDHRVLFAVTGADRKPSQRRCPFVVRVVRFRVVNRPNGKIDRAIDIANPGAPFMPLALIDNRNKAESRRR
jgi:hypothetical protein